MKQATLCLLVKDNKELLLAMKKRGFGVSTLSSNTTLHWKLTMKMSSRRDDEGMPSVAHQGGATKRSLRCEFLLWSQSIYSSGVVARRLCIPEDTLRSSRLARRINLSGQCSVVFVRAGTFIIYNFS